MIIKFVSQADFKAKHGVDWVTTGHAPAAALVKDVSAGVHSHLFSLLAFT